MASKNFLDVNPAFNRKASIALLDTAEELVDSLDNVAVCLKNVEERYLEVMLKLLFCVVLTKWMDGWMS